MDDLATFVERMVKAHEDRDLDALVDCWHPEVETEHLLCPDLSWHGTESYKRAMAGVWKNPTGRWEAVSTGVVGNRVYFETLTTHADGSLSPCISIFEVEKGKIRRARVYTATQVRNGVDMDSYVAQRNP